MNFRDLVENFINICEDGIRSAPLSLIDERQEEMMFKYYSDVLAKAKHSFPLNHLLNYFNSNDIKRYMLTCQSQRNFDRRSFVAKHSISSLPRFNIVIAPCKCMQKDVVYKIWMKQLFIKLLQRLDYDQHYRFFIHNNSIGIVTNFKSDLHEPLYVCSCGKCEWEINIHEKHLFNQLQIWNDMNLNNQIIFHNGAYFSILARQYLKHYRK